MRFLADESCDFAIVRALRNEGHDVLAVADAARGAKDAEVVRLARDEGRVLLTEDKDFGWYVYAAGEGGVGVVLIRFPAASRRLLGGAVLDAVRSQVGCGSVRLRRTTPSPDPAPHRTFEACSSTLSRSRTASSQKSGVLKNCVGAARKVLPVRLPVAKTPWSGIRCHHGSSVLHGFRCWGTGSPLWSPAEPRSMSAIPARAQKLRQASIASGP